MMMSLRLDEFTKQIVEEIVHAGVAPDRNEAIRMMIRHYNEHFQIKPMSEYMQDQLAIKKMQQVDEDIKSGKKKVMSEEDVLKKYPHLKDV